MLSALANVTWCVIFLCGIASLVRRDNDEDSVIIALPFIVSAITHFIITACFGNVPLASTLTSLVVMILTGVAVVSRLRPVK